MIWKCQILLIGNDSKTIRVNDPKIDIQKSVDKLEYKVR